MRKVAIVGGSDTTKDEAPYNNEAWEIWTLPWFTLPRSTRFFEPHENWAEMGHYPCGPRRESVVEYINECGVPTYMDKVEPDIPNSVAIDWQAMKGLRKVVGGDQPYIESTIAVMLAQAALELTCGDRVGVWGVDMDNDDEWAYQRPNAEYWIGRLEGKGVTVTIPPRSSLLSSCWPNGRYGAA